jgi:ABC-2 type transport system ATP-binding protein
LSVEVSGLTHRFGDRVALSDVSFSVRAGEVFALVGPNGSGKTTLFRVLSTSLALREGTVRLAGIDVRDAAVRRKIGVVFQSPGLDRKLTVLENLLCQGHLYGMGGRALRARCDELLGRFRVADRAGDRVEKLSGGLQRRVEIAKGLLHGPEILLLDEPSAGLDPGARRDYWELLRGLSGVTILLTTHLMEEAEKCDRLAILNHGKVVALGEPRALRAEIGGEVVTVRTAEPAALAEAIRSRFGMAPEVVDGTLRLEREGGYAFAAELAAAYPGRIEGVSVSRPSLEDVFHSKTREVWS